MIRAMTANDQPRVMELMSKLWPDFDGQHPSSDVMALVVY